MIAYRQVSWSCGKHQIWLTVLVDAIKLAVGIKIRQLPSYYQLDFGSVHSLQAKVAKGHEYLRYSKVELRTRILKAYSHSHLISGGSIRALLKCHCHF